MITCIAASFSDLPNRDEGATHGKAMTKVRIAALVSTLSLTIVGGTIFFRQVEKWSWIDSYFFSVVTLSTVGYGSLVPQTNAGKIGATIFIFLGLGVFAAVIQQIAQFTIMSREERLREREMAELERERQVVEREQLEEERERLEDERERVERALEVMRRNRLKRPDAGAAVDGSGPTAD